MTRSPFVIVGAVLLAALVRNRARAAVASSPTPARPRPSPPPHENPFVRQITEEALRQGVPPWVALTFADLESGFNPNAFGDRDWAQYHPEQWAAVRARMPTNPAIDDPAAWGSYGLFGLLAAYHVRPDEHPHVLWDSGTNISRGVVAIASALRNTDGDPAIARRVYVGCRADGSNCSQQRLATVDRRFAERADKWSRS